MDYEMIITGFFVSTGIAAILFTIFVSKSFSSLYWKGSSFKTDLKITIATVIPIAIAILSLQVSFAKNMKDTILTAPFFEELVKMTTVYVLYRATEVSKRLFYKRWVYYGFLAGISFGIFEYFVYVIGIGISEGVKVMLLTAIIRITPIYLHAFLGVIDSYGVKAFLEKRKLVAILMYSITVSIHFTYNYFAFLGMQNELYGIVSLIIGSAFVITMMIVTAKLPVKRKLSYKDFMFPVYPFSRGKIISTLFRFLLRPYDKIDNNKNTCPLWK